MYLSLSLSTQVGGGGGRGEGWSGRWGDTGGGDLGQDRSTGHLPTVATPDLGPAGPTGQVHVSQCMCRRD